MSCRGDARWLRAERPRRDRRSQQDFQGSRLGPCQPRASACSVSTRSPSPIPPRSKVIESFTVVDEYVRTRSPRRRAPVERIRSSTPTGSSSLGTASGGRSRHGSRLRSQPSLGWCCLAAGAEPLHWSAVRQIRYLAVARTRRPPQRRSPIIESMTAAGRASRQLGTVAIDSRRANCRLGCPPPTGWTYVATTSRGRCQLHQPMLIIQGGRDYQVTVEGDFATWQQALTGRPDVTVRIYPADNHFFFSGSGPSAPAESEPAQHVDAAVIADVADWIHRQER